MKKLIAILFLGLMGTQIALALAPGSYIQTCRNCTTDYYGTLTCSCLNANQVPVWSNLPQSNACASVSNNNGQLTCDSWYPPGPGPGPAPDPQALPPGSYSQSCTQCYIHNRKLTCQCQTAQGYWRWTSARLMPQCYYENQNGYLVCTQPRPLPPGPPPNPGHQVRKDVRNGTWTPSEMLG